MFAFLGLPGSRRMTGGMYFGAPGWHPHTLESPAETSPATAPEKLTPPPFADLTPDERRRALLRYCTDIGLGKTSAILPGLVDQLAALGTRRPRRLVLNLLPTQPEFVLGSALSQLAMDQLLAGLHLLQQILTPHKTVILMDSHDFRTAKLWRRALRKWPGKRTSFATKRVPTPTIRKRINRYPQAHPTLLAWCYLGRRLPVGSLPTQLSLLMVDPVGCWALGNSFLNEQRVTHRPIQVFDAFTRDAGEPRLLLGEIGKTISQFCHDCHCHLGGYQFIRNGMLAGEEIDPYTTRIATDTESLSVRETPQPIVSSPCISCGWCVDVCPTQLHPIRLMDLLHTAQKHEPTDAKPRTFSAEAAESRHCLGCGLCSYVCPSRLPLTSSILQLQVLRAPIHHATESHNPPSHGGTRP